MTGNETVDNWTTLLTIIDRPDAHAREELDRLAEGIMSNYKSRNGQILMAKTMVRKSGEVYNYVVVAFEQPAQHRYELSFTKMALAQNNAYVVVYGAHIGDPDYAAKAKAYLTRHAGEIAALWKFLCCQRSARCREKSSDSSLFRDLLAPSNAPMTNRRQR